MAQALAESKNWSSMNLLSVNIDSLLTTIGQSELPMETKIEDQTYIDNALKHMQTAKAYDLLDHVEKAFHESNRGLKMMDKLIAIRRDQALSEKVRNVNYESLIAPFYFRVGDFLANYILLNTDELGTVKPFTEEDDFLSDNEGEDEGAGADAQNVEEVKQEEEAPQLVEETKGEDAQAAPTNMMINTMGTDNKQADENEVAKNDNAAGGEEPENYE